MIEDRANKYKTGLLEKVDKKFNDMVKNGMMKFGKKLDE